MSSEQSRIMQKMLAYSVLSIAVFFWAVNTVIARSVIFEIKPMTLSFYRWLVAFIIILPFAKSHIQKDILTIKQNLGFLFVLAIPSITIYNSVLYLGAQYTSATNISLVVSTMPVMTLIFSWGMNQKKPGLLQSFGIGLSLLGMLVIISKGSWRSLLGLSFNRGDLLIVVSIASWAFYSVLLKKRDITMSPISFLTMIIFLGTLLILPFYLWELNQFGGIAFNGSNIVLFLFLGIFPSIISYICWNYGVRSAGASIASVFMYLLPVFTSIIAYFYLDERLVLYHFSGGTLILIGLILSSKNPTPG